ncbi:MAG: bifunctional ADP-dependent NAD(P)H-hydrate dehydratase/NAD(P)H-hydrate epimerase [Firmicutes bacterium HGW-Firmicutes-15]|nr:MAG: bifunctional ADP-dependent NAD(P)H-hydrate dehydratase/NAD(P)H-hydrate epimerase [Firmicutes bacterium HGW-Firmicutes-15]
MKLLTAEQMKDIDRRATDDYLIPGLILMENAGLRVLETIEGLIGELRNAKIIILAGKGNNGGDGLVLGRHLINAGALVDTFLLGEPQNMSSDANINYSILKKMSDSLFPLRVDEDLNRLMIALLSADIIVDAIYGIGFRGSLDDFENRIAQMVNWSQAVVVAVDIPSGVEANTGKIHGIAIKANHTVTFALPKLGLVLDPGRDYVGTLTVADISIPQALLEDDKFKLNLIGEAMVKRLLKPRMPESHKGTYGHALVIGGSTGMTGAVIMTSYAALRTGAGLVTAALPESLVPILEASVMEVMSRALPETSEATISLEALPAIENLLGTVSVCAIGPGMSTYQEANAILRQVLEKSGVPILIDADGLNALAGDTAIFKDRQVPIVITPHPGEMARLTGLTVEEIQQNRLEIARNYAVEWGITVVLKGNKTVVASPSGEVFINMCGNPGMATAGSGDVLSGIILGLMAQGLRPQSAAVAGVYIHGSAGDRAAEILGQRGLIAGDLLNHLPYVLHELEKS